MQACLFLEVAGNKQLRMFIVRYVTKFSDHTGLLIIQIRAARLMLVGMITDSIRFSRPEC